ncbi:hypothetical protein YTPLAS18_11340 [Nitrospira sp.]|nr:hypothetical protein YTPLAS18_11340 [Nitrospira sp.]
MEGQLHDHHLDMDTPSSDSHERQEQPTLEQKQLSISSILRLAFAYPWAHRYELPKLLLIPVVMASLACVIEQQVLTGSISDTTKTLISVVTFLPDLLIVTLAAVPWHRSILLGESRATTAWLPHFGKRERRYFGWFLLVNLVGYAAMGLVGGTIGALVGLFVAGASGTEIQRLFDHTDLFVVVLATALIPYAYLVGRLSLVLPSIATDREATLMDAWRLSKGNTWRLTFLIGVIPILFFLSEGWGMNGIQWVLGSTTLESFRILGLGHLFSCVPETVLHYLVLTIELAILSFSYRDLAD